MSEPSVPVVFGAGQLVTGAGNLGGVTLRETAGAVATVRLFDNTAGSGTLIGTYGFAALQSIDIDFTRARRFKAGVFAVVTGTVEGSIFV